LTIFIAKANIVNFGVDQNTNNLQWTWLTRVGKQAVCEMEMLICAVERSSTLQLALGQRVEMLMMTQKATVSSAADTWIERIAWRESSLSAFAISHRQSANKPWKGWQQLARSFSGMRVWRMIEINSVRQTARIAHKSDARARTLVVTAFANANWRN